MEKLPAWVAALREDKELTARLGLRWLDEEEQTATHELWRSTWNQVPYDEDFHGRCAKRLETAIPVARGLTRHRRLGKSASSIVVVIDPDEPDVLWLSLSHAMPSLAWAVGGSTSDELAAALRYYGGSDAKGVDGFSRSDRLVKPIDVDDIEVIQNSVRGLELWIDDASWGSAFVDDPWTTVDTDAGMLVLSQVIGRVGEQDRGRRPSVSYRTLWSRSILTIEQHSFGLWVFAIKYDPAADRRAIEKLAGAELGSRLPPDLPVDIAASLMRGDSLTRESIRMRETSSLGPFDLAVRCAIDPGEASTIDTLRWAIDAWSGEDKIRSLADVLSANNHTSLLFEMAASTQDEELRAQLVHWLEPAPDQETEVES